MAGYELPVTRVPGLGSMDQIGAALGTGPATDYLGNIISSKLVTIVTSLSSLRSRPRSRPRPRLQPGLPSVSVL